MEVSTNTGLREHSLQECKSRSAHTYDCHCHFPFRLSHCGLVIWGRGYSGQGFDGSTLQLQGVWSCSLVQLPTVACHEGLQACTATKHAEIAELHLQDASALDYYLVEGNVSL